MSDSTSYPVNPTSSRDIAKVLGKENPTTTSEQLANAILYKKFIDFQIKNVIPINTWAPGPVPDPPSAKAEPGLPQGQGLFLGSMDKLRPSTNIEHRTDWLNAALSNAMAAGDLAEVDSSVAPHSDRG